ncbi:MAG: hypothetical protein MI784_13755 [Cytophagales bacterium]|nr:hypothetical protein [Cytophagales bacterium]
MNQVKIENEVLQIENVEKGNSLWKWLTRLGGVLGLVASAYVVYQNLFMTPSVSVKKISYARSGIRPLSYHSDESGEVSVFKGVKYFMKLAINVENKDLNYQDIYVVLDYGDGRKISAKHFYPNRYFQPWKREGKHYVLKVPEKELLIYHSVIKKNTTTTGYLAFVVQDSSLRKADPESIQIAFKKSNGKLLKSEVKRFPVSDLLSVYDPSIWKLSNEQKKKIIDRRLKSRTFTEFARSHIWYRPQDSLRAYKHLNAFIMRLHNELMQN